MASNIIDMEEKNWLYCQTCNRICKCPNFDNDLRLDECCICSDSEIICSACYERKKVDRRSN